MFQQAGQTGSESTYSPLIDPIWPVLGQVYGRLRAAYAQKRAAAAHVVGMAIESNVPQLMSTEQLAEYLQIPVRTLEDWRSPRRQCGPKWIRLGKRVRYRRATVDAWLESQEASADASPDAA